MTAVPVIRTWVAGEVVVASYFNTNLNGPISFLLAPPILEIRLAAAQTFTTGTLTAALYDTEDVDSSGMHSTSSNTSRATAVYPGWYIFAAAQSWASNATGTRQDIWRVNGTDANGSQVIVNASVASIIQIVARTKHLFLNATDYAELFASQSSGGNLASAVTGGQQPHLSARWVSN